MERRAGIEPACASFAERCLATWLPTRSSGGRSRTFIAGSKGQRPTVRRPLIDKLSTNYSSHHSESNRALSRTRRACRKPRAPWWRYIVSWTGPESNPAAAGLQIQLAPLEHACPRVKNCRCSYPSRSLKAWRRSSYARAVEPPRRSTASINFRSGGNDQMPQCCAIDARASRNPWWARRGSNLSVRWIAVVVKRAHECVAPFATRR